MLSLEGMKHTLRLLNLGAVIIPSGDEFLSEYVAEHSNRLMSVTGFSGSNGMALIGCDGSLFFTDGRYILQAKTELDLREFKVLGWLERFNISEHWEQVLHANKRVGYDPKLHAYSEVQRLKALLASSGVELVAIDLAIEHGFEDYQILHLSPTDTGYDTRDKILQLIRCCDVGVSHLLITQPSCISWLLNLRVLGLVPYNPLLLGYGLLNLKTASITLFTDVSFDRVPEGVEKVLKFADLSEYLRQLSSGQAVSLQLDLRSVNDYTLHFIEELNIKWCDVTDPIMLLKVTKHPVEIEGFRRAHIIDGVAKTKWLHWLHTHGGAGYNEFEAAKKLLEFRCQHDEFIMESFEAIAAYAENAAIIHYHAGAKGGALIGKEHLFLIDSGGHYYHGTTDATRTVHLGQPSGEQKRLFTLVLKAHIALAQARFPCGTYGYQLDVLARQHLWQYGLDYAHGTGHGVGNMLSVHEGPVNISSAASHHAVPLGAGMVLSNEPGVYLNGVLGIRFENLMLVKSDDELGGWLCFEPLTMLPIQSSLIEEDLLNETERQWVTQYQQRVMTVLAPWLGEAELSWIKQYMAL
jgi:Xaa-Pro aminopeptidase